MQRYREVHKHERDDRSKGWIPDCCAGIDFPFEANSFDMVITRYALHHFPDIDHSISEVARVLKPGGSFFLSDPCPNDCDCNRFVDEYMQLKKDGHIKFYTEDEWRDICGECRMKQTDSFKSNIRFPKKKETAYGYEEELLSIYITNRRGCCNGFYRVYKKQQKYSDGRCFG